MEISKVKKENWKIKIKLVMKLNYGSSSLRNWT